MSIEQTDSFWL